MELVVPMYDIRYTRGCGMGIYIEFYEPPPGREVLGRFMDDMVSMAAEGADEKDKVFDAALIYLPGLRDKDLDELKDHLVTCKVWRWFDDLAVYRTSGEPYALFAVIEDDNEEASSKTLVLGLGVTRSGSLEAEYEALIRARCRSWDLCT